MKNRWLALLLSVSFAAQGQSNLNLTNWTFTNLQGRVYSNVVVESTDPVSVRFRFNGIESRVFLTNLPPEVRTIFHYDPAKVAALKAKEDAVASAQQNRQQDFARIKKGERRDLMEVLQVVPDGVLANAIIGVPEEYAQAAAAGRTKLDYSWRRDLVLLWHYPGKTFDGAYIIVTNYQIGTYQYITVGKTDKTVPRLTIDLGIAIEYLHNPNSITFYTDSEVDALAEAKRSSREAKPDKTTDSGKDVADSNPTGSGTGFFITDDGYLISNNHVVKDATQVRLITSAGLISARVVRVDAANDLALLKAEGKFASLPITSSRAMKLGGTVVTVGFPNIVLQGFAPKFARGEIASLSGAADDPRYFQISVPVQPGNSGSALVDGHGNVVGVVSAKLNASSALAESGALPENVNYAVKSSLLLSFLESVPEVSAKLNEANTEDRQFEDVVKSAEQAAVLVLVY